MSRTMVQESTGGKTQVGLKGQQPLATLNASHTLEDFDKTFKRLPSDTLSLLKAFSSQIQDHKSILLSFSEFLQIDSLESQHALLGNFQQPVLNRGAAFGSSDNCVQTFI